MLQLGLKSCLQTLKMPVTRSASGALPRKSNGAPVAPESSLMHERPKPKRKSTAAPSKAARKKPRSGAGSDGDILPETVSDGPRLRAVPAPSPDEDAAELVPAVLTFSFSDAKRHLTKVDRRFEELFRLLKCRPFEHLEMLDPFRTLANSIMGQQISWRAARSITHRFIRLFDPSLPEKPVDHHKITWFPTARQVESMDVATLRSAGLSGRKAEYVLDLAARFADGRLSTQKLLEADDEALASMLIEVRGIGRWTVDMFAIFSLRRPDILPVGDLGVQRGLLRWFLSLHSPSYPLTISPEKLPKNPEEQEASQGASQDAGDTLPVYGEASTAAHARALTPDSSSVLPAPPLPANGRKGKGKAAAAPDSDTESGVPLPAPFTPSINKTLNMHARGGADELPVPLPDGLTAAVLRSRLDGKKKIKGAFVTPQEMEALTACWRPYRSLAVFYMWALAEPPK